MAPTIQLLFFLGKGGTGKSTLSALCALHLAGRDKRVLHLSTDPAHNLADIYQLDLTSQAEKLPANLRVHEIELEIWIKRYLKNIQQQMQKSYRYLTALSLERHFNIIKYSPGLEEYAMLQAIDYYMSGLNSGPGLLVIDMPPTALSLKFFNLPDLSVVWLKQLLQLRQLILEKKEIVQRLKADQGRNTADKVERNIRQQIDKYTFFSELFRDFTRTRIQVVSNTDRLSLAESERILNHLREKNIEPAGIIFNKWQAEQRETIPLAGGPSIRRSCIALSDRPLLGLKQLTTFLDNNRREFDALLSFPD